MHIEGNIIRLRAVEPDDIEMMYRWENDPAVWAVSGTTEPFSREQMARFVERQAEGADLMRTGQLRLIIETHPGSGDTRWSKPKTKSGSGGADCPKREATEDSGVAKKPEDYAPEDSGVAEVQEGNATESNTTESGFDAKTPGDSGSAPCPVGAVDLFEYDPINRRAGVGILIYAPEDRERGYASDAMAALCRYSRETLGLHQLWCNVGTDNEASLRLFRRLGFSKIGVKRQWQWHPDGYRDEAMMQKILE